MMRLSFLGAVAALAFASTASASDFAIPVDGDFNEDGIEWNGGLGKAYEFRWDAVLSDGAVAICGAGKFLDATTRQATVGLLRKAKVILDGKVVMKDLSYFAKYPKSQDLGKVKATCRSTGAKPAGKNSAVELDISGRARF